MSAQLVVERAIPAWQRCIYDPPVENNSSPDKACKDAITTYIREGLSWRSWTDKLSGQITTTYRGDKSLPWCGAFAAYCWKPLVPAGINRDVFASTYKLYKAGALDKRWRVPIDQVQPGDIVVMGTKHAWGEHIGIAISPSISRYVPTIEGNGTGLVRGQGARQGVVLQMRSLDGPYPVRFAYRPPA